jgi:type IX secretion system PorP/SprF family membrane protein
VHHYNFSNDLFTDANMGDPTIDNAGKDKGFYFNANFGAYFRWDNFFAGVSATNLIPSKMVEFGKDEPAPPLIGFLFSGYDIEMSNSMTLEPAFMFKMNEESNKQLDLNLKFMQTLPDNEDFAYWLQASYRQGLDNGNSQPLALSPMGGIRYKGFHLAYAYTLGLTALNRHNSGTHEVMLGYTWCVTKQFCR